MATSNYIASGWIASSGAYNQDGLLSGSVPSRDIFNGALTVGVYQVFFNNGVGQRPVFCSCNDLSNIGILKNKDRAWLVYPGYGIKLFSQTNWSGIASNTYYNTTTLPVLFATEQYWGINTLLARTGQTTTVYKEGSTTDLFGKDNTQSIRVYFRGNRSTGSEYEVTINGLTS